MSDEQVEQFLRGLAKALRDAAFRAHGSVEPGMEIEIKLTYKADRFDPEVARDIADRLDPVVGAPES